MTTGTVVRRFGKHKHYAEIGSVCFLHRAIAKYGADSFIVEEIDQAESIEELRAREIFHISRLRTMAPNGYNLTIGGEGLLAPTAEIRQKLSKAKKGRPGHSISKETRRKISRALRGRQPECGYKGRQPE